MILHVSPQAPTLVRDAAAALLVLHIGGGCMGLLSGATALAARKGSRAHQIAGNVFFVSMLSMATVGATVSPVLADPISAAMGVFAFYLVLTGWGVVIRGPGRTGRFEIAAMALGLGAAAWLLTLGVLGAGRPHGIIGGQPFQIGVAFGSLALLSALFDLRAIRAGGIAGPPRIARQLWRMCFALFVASGSFFLGQPQVFPPPLHGSPILVVLAVAPLGFLAFWMIRVRLRRAPKASRNPAAARGALAAS